MKKKLSKKIKTFLIILFAIIIGIYIYNTYKNIDINSNKYETSRTLSTKSEKTVENEEEKSAKVTTIIEESTESIVGISKLKNIGKTILNNATETDMGIGSGVIVSSNGYIVSNEHVTGKKFSECFVTTEARKSIRWNSTME